MARTRYLTLWARLMANCRPNAKTECWDWTGSFRLSRGGGRYPRINIVIEGKHTTLSAHRVVAEIVMGRKLCTEEETLEHTCTNTICINPNHFLLATRVANSGSMRARILGKEDEHARTMIPLTRSGYFVHPSEAIPF